METTRVAAARYFGLQEERRTSINLGDGRIGLVARRSLWVYDTTYGTGFSVLLTPNRLGALIDALTALRGESE